MNKPRIKKVTDASGDYYLQYGDKHWICFDGKNVGRGLTPELSYLDYKRFNWLSRFVNWFKPSMKLQDTHYGYQPRRSTGQACNPPSSK